MIRQITPTTARRLAITKQHLSGELPKPDAARMLEVVRDIGCLQLDPISAVARSHQTVLFSRLGKYNLSDIDQLLWQDRSLFEYWAHAASIVLTEDYPIHRWHMEAHHESKSPWHERTRQWVSENQVLHDRIMSEITAHGALPSTHFEDESKDGWQSSGWTSNRNVSQMLGYLWDTGVLMIAGRKGNGRLWDLTERCLPDWASRDILPTHEVVYHAAQKSLRALGVGTLKHIQQHYTRSRYPGLPDVLKTLETDNRIQRLEIAENGTAWPGPYYVHVDDLPLLESIESGHWKPRTTLLSPFDNLICDRTRTEKFWDFDFRIEIYVPKDKRKYGYYVLPILHGDKLIGRIDPLMNRKEKRLQINNVYTEPDAPQNTETAQAVRGAIDSLADFLGAKNIDFTANVPSGWQTSLR